VGGIEYWIISKRHSTKLKLFFLEFILEPINLPNKKEANLCFVCQVEIFQTMGPLSQSIGSIGKPLTMRLHQGNVIMLKPTMYTSYWILSIFLSLNSYIYIWNFRGMGGCALDTINGYACAKVVSNMGIITFWVLFVTRNLIKIQTN
jgi:hypothetical protein